MRAFHPVSRFRTFAAYNYHRNFLANKGSHKKSSLDITSIATESEERERVSKVRENVNKGVMCNYQSSVLHFIFPFSQEKYNKKNRMVLSDNLIKWYQMASV